MKAVIYSLLPILICLHAEARYTSGDRERDTVAATKEATRVSSTTQSGQGTVSSGYESLEQNSKDTMTNSQKGQTTSTIMQIGMYGLGAMYASACPPTNYAACVKAAVLFYMGSQAGKSAASFQAPIETAWDNTCTYSTLGCNGSTPNNPFNAAVPPDGLKSAPVKKEEITLGLSKGGFSVDVGSGKIKTPTGEIDANDPSSLASALGADGMSKLNGEVSAMEKDARAKVDQIKTAAVTAALGFEGGGSGGIATLGEGGYGDGSDAGAGKGAGGGLASKLDKLRKPAAKGLTKNFNGDPIGVAADSIFEMMSRRYQLKSVQKTFIGAEVQTK